MSMGRVALSVVINKSKRTAAVAGLLEKAFSSLFASILEVQSELPHLFSLAVFDDKQYKREIPWTNISYNTAVPRTLFESTAESSRKSRSFIEACQDTSKFLTGLAEQGLDSRPILWVIHFDDLDSNPVSVLEIQDTSIALQKKHKCPISFFTIGAFDRFAHALATSEEFMALFKPELTDRIGLVMASRVRSYLNLDLQHPKHLDQLKINLLDLGMLQGS